ncbi:MAG TPA: FAD-dependent monooxygenase [Chitinophagaceae bacterium]
MRIQGSYDVAIIGGGLGGLALSIQSARAGYSTILFEKEHYPFHRVCGEYISLESWNFLEDLGLPLSDMNLPIIKKVLISSPSGNTIEHSLSLGGFGISRYTIDQQLASIAKREGAIIADGIKVTDATFNGSEFTLQTMNHDKAQPGLIHAKMVAGSFGKRSNLDVKWNRSFIRHKPNKLNNYIGVKYHIRTDHPADRIALHNFSNGYCGISRIEDDKCCLCYLTTAENLKKCDNSIKKLEEEVLCKNPFLQRIFSNSDFLMQEPVVISQISFERKTLVEDHILMVGDAAGMITPLCGNGMSMALHAGKLAFNEMNEYFRNGENRDEVEKNYSGQWKKHFAGRMRIGRFIQGFFGHTVLSNVLISSLKPFPGVAGWLIRQTHGEPF